MSRVIIAALQNVGSAIGNMICVNNVVSAAATTGTIGRESKIVRTNLIPCLIYCIAVILVLGGLLPGGVYQMPIVTS